MQASPPSLARQAIDREQDEREDIRAHWQVS